MARITVEDCLTKETNRFALVLLAAKRTKQLLHGQKALVSETKNKAVVTALREIADGKVRFMTIDEMQKAAADKVREQEELRALAAAEAQRAVALTAAATLGPTMPTFERPAAAAVDADEEGEKTPDASESANR